MFFSLALQLMESFYKVCGNGSCHYIILITKSGIQNYNHQITEKKKMVLQLVNHCRSQNITKFVELLFSEAEISQ